MLLLDQRRFIKAPFTNEAELESVVLENYEYIFGPDSILLLKKLIHSADGAGTIPDAFALDLQQKIWYIVEAELLAHGVWAHIAPQIAKQLVASTQQSTRDKLEDVVANLYQSDKSVQIKFEEHEIKEINVRAVVKGILSKMPVVAIPIDSISRDLRLWAEQQKAEIRLWEIKKLVDFDDLTKIAYEVPDEFTPTIDTAPVKQDKLAYTISEVTLGDLIAAGLLTPKQELKMSYKPHDGQQKDYRATLAEDGSIHFQGENYSSPSNVALRVIKNAGSNRTTVNGWITWQVQDGRNLAQIRKEFLAKKMD
jgi:hypothetical protein